MLIHFFLITGASRIPKELEPYLPPRREVTLPSGRPLSEVGSLPIVHMRSLMQGKALSAELVKDVTTRYEKNQHIIEGRGGSVSSDSGSGVKQQTSKSR